MDHYSRREQGGVLNTAITAITVVSVCLIGAVAYLGQVGAMAEVLMMFFGILGVVAICVVVFKVVGDVSAAASEEQDTRRAGGHPIRRNFSATRGAK